jgi:hypothetical protein
MVFNHIGETLNPSKGQTQGNLATQSYLPLTRSIPKGRRVEGPPKWQKRLPTLSKVGFFVHAAENVARR